MKEILSIVSDSNEIEILFDEDKYRIADIDSLDGSITLVKYSDYIEVK